MIGGLVSTCEENFDLDLDDTNHQFTTNIFATFFFFFTSDANDNRFISPPDIPFTLPGLPMIVS
jgi:hypothetical protein